MHPIIDTLQAWNELPTGVPVTRRTVGFEVSKVVEWEPDGSGARMVQANVTCLLHRDFFVVGGVKIPSPRGTILEIVSHGRCLMMLGAVEHVGIGGDGCATLQSRDLPQYVVHTTVPADDQTYHDVLAEA